MIYDICLKKIFIAVHFQPKKKFKKGYSFSICPPFFSTSSVCFSMNLASGGSYAETKGLSGE